MQAFLLRIRNDVHTRFSDNTSTGSPISDVSEMAYYSVRQYCTSEGGDESHDEESSTGFATSDTDQDDFDGRPTDAYVTRDCSEEHSYKQDTLNGKLPNLNKHFRGYDNHSNIQFTSRPNFCCTNRFSQIAQYSPGN